MRLMLSARLLVQTKQEFERAAGEMTNRCQDVITNELKRTTDDSLTTLRFDETLTTFFTDLRRIPINTYSGKL